MIGTGSDGLAGQALPDVPTGAFSEPTTATSATTKGGRKPGFAAASAAAAAAAAAAASDAAVTINERAITRLIPPQDVLTRAESNHHVVISPEACELVSDGLQQLARSLLEDCVGRSRRRRHVGSFTTHQLKLQGEARGQKGGRAELNWGLDVASALAIECRDNRIKARNAIYNLEARYKEEIPLYDKQLAALNRAKGVKPSKDDSEPSNLPDRRRSSLGMPGVGDPIWWDQDRVDKSRLTGILYSSDAQIVENPSYGWVDLAVSQMRWDVSRALNSGPFRMKQHRMRDGGLTGPLEIGGTPAQPQPQLGPDGGLAVPSDVPITTPLAHASKLAAKASHTLSVIQSLSTNNPGVYPLPAPGPDIIILPDLIGVLGGGDSTAVRPMGGGRFSSGVGRCVRYGANPTN
jgi:hypothetical protein